MATSLLEPHIASGARDGRRGFPIVVWLGFAIVAVACIAAAFGSLIAPQSADQQNLLGSVAGPSWHHLLGTDQLGRDLFSRLIVGARTAVVGPAIIAVGGFTIGMLFGLLSGYLGGALDTIIMRGVDVMFALPALLIALVIIGITGGGYTLAIVLLVVLFSPADTRIVRGEVLRQRGLPYIEALRVLGCSRRRIMFRHIAPNVLPVVIAYVFLDFGFGLVALSALSFLGVGVPPGNPDWGRMLYENRAILFTNAAAEIAPGIAIVVLAASMNLIGDALYERYARR